jgi:hypothetical protein
MIGEKEHVEKSSVIPTTRDRLFIKIHIDSIINCVPTEIYIHQKRHIEQTTTFHACSVSESMSILIDQTKERIVQA